MKVFVLYHCKKCNAGYRVSIADADLSLLKDSMNCPNKAECKGRIKKVGETDQLAKFPTKILTARELYAATMGVGLPQERVCSPKNLRKLLVGKKIVDLALAPSSDPQRSFIYAITIEGGKVFHFAMSSQAATIYKMTEVQDVR
jgi:hypothetical protein